MCIRDRFFVDKYSYFFVTNFEKIYCRRKKLEILAMITSETNFPKIFEEICFYLKNHQREVNLAAIECLGRLALKNKKFGPKCSKVLLNILKCKNQEMVSSAVLALANYIQSDISKNTPLLAFFIKKLLDINSPAALKIIVALTNQIIDVGPTLALECLRLSVKKFHGDDYELKCLILDLCLNIYKKTPTDNANFQYVENLMSYLIDLGSFDQQIMVREKARFLCALFRPNLKGSAGVAPPAKCAVSKDVLEANLQELNIDLTSYADQYLASFREAMRSKSDVEDQESFTIGSLSHLINARMANFRALPGIEDICSEDTNAARDVAFTAEMTGVGATSPLVSKKVETAPTQEDKGAMSPKEAATAQAPGETKPVEKESVVQKAAAPAKEKQIDVSEELASGKNLNKILDDFFSDEEEEEDDDDEDDEKAKKQYRERDTDTNSRKGDQNLQQKGNIQMRDFSLMLRV
eukprot:TRINITY_DN5440_c0_g1_i4.p1 TRINITY_DN5440_c0_g1~~TRINITY_DN5440_c0_g1_i4.p1  ORF type:complete len:466 (-),score=153.90 TRINITY_DN5440_c0_g1_i4:1052-2449(-)